MESWRLGDQDHLIDAERGVNPQPPPAPPYIGRDGILGYIEKFGSVCLSDDGTVQTLPRNVPSTGNPSANCTVPPVDTNPATKNAFALGSETAGTGVNPLLRRINPSTLTKRRVIEQDK